MRIFDIITENDRRDFMKRMGKTAAATAGALAMGSFVLPSKAWPDDLPQNFNFMDEFLSDKVINDPKYKEFKDVGEKLLKMLQDIENSKKQKKGIEV
jgi:hypothetical protein|tara:strand:- start:910 stop:1200 length:291 start_codon:yes stop_codon:yes gene_type:complete